MSAAQNELGAVIGMPGVTSHKPVSRELWDRSPAYEVIQPVSASCSLPVITNATRPNNENTSHDALLKFLRSGYLCYSSSPNEVLATDFHIERLNAFVHVENVASIRVLGKIGFRGSQDTIMGMKSILFSLRARNFCSSRG
jgi:hypothetical protein